MPSTYDLHCHSTASDGTLTPAALVARAAERGVQHLALTDHDTLAGLDEARQAASVYKVNLINGAELSATWNKRTLHIVGLFFDAESPALQSALNAVQQARCERAQRISEALARTGISGALEGARRFVTNPTLISRSHFARFLVERGTVASKQKAFDRFLGQGKPGYVPHAWPTLQTCIETLHAAGGLAVLAHPGRYPLTPTALRRLLEEFRDLGGDAIEVFSSSHAPPQNTQFIEYARFYGFKASLGSDFHGPLESYLDLGALPPLPAGLTPVWAS